MRDLLNDRSVLSGEGQSHSKAPLVGLRHAKIVAPRGDQSNRELAWGRPSSDFPAVPGFHILQLLPERGLVPRQESLRVSAFASEFKCAEVLPPRTVGNIWIGADPKT